MKDIWVIPCNVKVYDVVAHFKQSDSICWKRGAREKIGDDVYIYVGNPYKAIMFKCVVENDNVSDDEIKEHPYATKGHFGSGFRYMKLHKAITFENPVELKKLQELGVYMVRKQGRVGKQLLEYLIGIENDIQ